MLLNGFVGVALGFLAGLGVGGGSLLMLWLTLVADMDYDEARLLNLLYFIPRALISPILQGRQKKLPIKKLLSAICAGLIAAAGCSLLNIPVKYLKKIFGALLLLAGVRELCYRPRKPK